MQNQHWLEICARLIVLTNILDHKRLIVAAFSQPFCGCRNWWLHCFMTLWTEKRPLWRLKRYEMSLDKYLNRKKYLTKIWTNVGSTRQHFFLKTPFDSRVLILIRHKSVMMTRRKSIARFSLFSFLLPVYWTKTVVTGVVMLSSYYHRLDSYTRLPFGQRWLH